MIRVFVYKNIRTHQFSAKALVGPDRGRVIARGDTMELVDVSFRVSEAGRQRVLREKRKNVHAGVVGTLVRSDADAPVLDTPVTYDPYKWASFVRRADGTAVIRAARASLRPEGVTAEGVS